MLKSKKLTKRQLKTKKRVRFNLTKSIKRNNNKYLQKKKYKTNISKNKKKHFRNTRSKKSKIAKSKNLKGGYGPNGGMLGAPIEIHNTTPNPSTVSDGLYDNIMPVTTRTNNHSQSGGNGLPSLFPSDITKITDNIMYGLSNFNNNLNGGTNTPIDPNPEVQPIGEKNGHNYSLLGGVPINMNDIRNQAALEASNT